MPPALSSKALRWRSSIFSRMASPCLAIQARRPGMGDSVAKWRSRGNSPVSVSTTCLISESPKLTPRRPVWVLLME